MRYEVEWTEKETEKREEKRKHKVIIMGAAGRDFHNFNVYFRDNDKVEVVAFTATQIPGISKRVYPTELAGLNYPAGISIYPEEELPNLIRGFDVDEVVFAYSDVSQEYVMHKASIVLATGADFRLMGPKSTMLKAKVPVISVCAVRTGAGKSPTSRAISRILSEKGLCVVIVRHPMPYGDLSRQACQRFSSYEDLHKQEATIEEREEYEPYIEMGFTVYAGVDYKQILLEAEKEGDVILWDGGNNDFPFYKPDLHIVVVDPLRPGHELRYHPGETNVRMADVIIINKVDSADESAIKTVERNVKSLNPDALIVKTISKIEIEGDGSIIKGKKALVVEDGPTLTHGGMPYGAGTLVAKCYEAGELIDPREFAVGSIKEVYNVYKHLGPVLPAMGYSLEQIEELNETIKASGADVVVVGTPIDLRKVADIKKPTVRAKYSIEETGKPTLEEIIFQFLEVKMKKSGKE